MAKDDPGLAGALGARGADMVLRRAPRASPRGHSLCSAPTLARVRVATGSTRWRRRSARSLVPAVATPPAGSQPSPAANTRISTRASQKVGIDTPAKQNRLIAASSRESGCRAAIVPSVTRKHERQDKARPHQQQRIAEPRQQHRRDRRREQPRIAEFAAERLARPREVAGKQRPVDAIELLQPGNVLGAHARVGRAHQVDRIARHQPDQRIDDERHQRQQYRDLDQADGGEADHRAPDRKAGMKALLSSAGDGAGPSTAAPTTR